MDFVLSAVNPTKPPRVLGPFVTVWLDHEALRGEPGGPVLAVHHKHQWVVDNERYLRLDATAPVSIHFENANAMRSRRGLGVVQRFSLVDGLVFAQDEVIAHLDRGNEWFCYELAEKWPLMVLTQAPGKERWGV